ncbi:hypothetical protein PTMSG1_08481 [Pyrenophora teres f. maculata]|nr:hypothetical protein PTMSG1_08481 [Pyrenophora teres f. maculata]
MCKAAPRLARQHSEPTEEPETPPAPPEGRLSDEPTVKVTVNLKFIMSTQHISKSEFGVGGSFISQGPNVKAGCEHKNASIAFT